MNPVHLWDRIWFTKTSARPLGVFRIAFGLIVLEHLALLLPDLDTWLSDSGRLRGSEAAELAGPLRWSPLQVYQDPLTVRLFIAATFLVAVLFTLGWWTRIMGALLYGLLLSIHHRNIMTTSGADVLLLVVSFYLVFSRCGAAFSLDARRESLIIGVPYEPLISVWPQRLIAFQTSMIYLLTAYLKIKGQTWRDGTALYYVLNNGEARRFTLGLTEYPDLLRFMTYAALAIEFALAGGLWFRKTRPWAIVAGVALHAGIMITVNIPVFGELMMATYLVFLSPQEFSSLMKPLMTKQVGKISFKGRIDPGSALSGLAPREIREKSLRD